MPKKPYGLPEKLYDTPAELVKIATDANLDVVEYLVYSAPLPNLRSSDAHLAELVILARDAIKAIENHIDPAPNRTGGVTL